MGGEGQEKGVLLKSESMGWVESGHCLEGRTGHCSHMKKTWELKYMYLPVLTNVDPYLEAAVHTLSSCYLQRGCAN